MKSLQISVRNLVEFLFREGDLDSGSGSPDYESMLDGIRIHKKIQSKRGGDYRSEVPLSFTVSYEKYDIRIDGRTDGVYLTMGEIFGHTKKSTKRLNKKKSETKSQKFLKTCESLGIETVVENSQPEAPTDQERLRELPAVIENTREEALYPLTMIEEIKGTWRDFLNLNKPDRVHLAQALCYAYFYAASNDKKFMGVSVTYCHLETEEIRSFYHVYSREVLEEWFYELMEKYRRWSDFLVEWEEIRSTSIKDLDFPYDYRHGQKDLVSSVYKTILRKKKLFIQAPTGSGKTLACVYPSVKAMGEGLAAKVFYLTAKTITRQAAWHGFEILKLKGLKAKVISLTAKEKICITGDVQCNPRDCPFAKGHFDRVNDAIFELLTSTDDFSREALLEHARKHKVCPFEMGLDLSLWADAVICDYNYVFDPNAHLRRYFSESSKEDYIFLIDEAHNLVERGREMYSARLSKEEILSAKRDINAIKEKRYRTVMPLIDELSECNKVFLREKRQLLLQQTETADDSANFGNRPGTYRVLSSFKEIHACVTRVMNKLEIFLEDDRKETRRGHESFAELIINFYFRVRDFLNIADILDDNYVIYSELAREGEIRVVLYCVNPAKNLNEYMAKGRSTVFFSATLLPINYYKSLLSIATDDYAIYARTVFKNEQKIVLIGTDVSTKYAKRTESMYAKYAYYLKEIVSAKAGNYIAFFPSYKFMTEVYEEFCKCTGDISQIDVTENETNQKTKIVRVGKININVLVQSQFMTEADRESFLEKFEDEDEETLLGFCVLGGIFSEGIDLTHDKLIGAIIAGTALPQVCLERELLKQHFDKSQLNGFDYAYLYPGMNKVMQAAGRVIRTEHDRGIILLLDDRFKRRDYQNVFPREWDGAQTCSLANVKEKLAQFWQEE